MNGAIGEGVCERLVHEPVLVEEREAVEARARDGDLEVVAAAGAVGHVQLGRVWEGLLEELPEPVEGAHRRCAKYSSRSERVRTPIGLPRRATTIAFVRPVSVAKTSSNDSPASIVASGGCMASTTSSYSASGSLKTRSSRSRSWSEPITSARELTSPSRTTGSCEI